MPVEDTVSFDSVRFKLCITIFQIIILFGGIWLVKSFLRIRVKTTSLCGVDYRVVQKKRPILLFIPELCFTKFFSYFSGGVDSRPERFFWHQYGSNWTIYYAAADKNHRGVLCHKISSSDTVAMQERFWQGQCIWWKENSTFGGQILGDRKCSRCPTKATVVNIIQIVQIQQARAIFNPLTDIFTKCFSFCFILISLPLQVLNFVRKDLKVIMEYPQNWCSQNASFLWKMVCWFSGEILMAFS